MLVVLHRLECCQLGPQWKWYVKSTEYRGETNLTSYAYTNCTSEAHEVTLPQDAMNGEWSVSTGNGFVVQPAVRCSTVPIPALAQILAAKRAAIAAMRAVPPVPGSFTISGASGARAFMVNGVYEPTTDRCNGEIVYRNKDAPDYYLEYVNFNGSRKWYVKSSQYRGPDNSTSYAYCDMTRSGTGLIAIRPRSWRVSTGNGFEAQESVSCTRI